jgi:hypothetical protein
MQSAKDALAAMGLDLDEVVDIDNGLRTRPNTRDGRICLCGHAVSKHTDFGNGVMSCKPSKMDCPCKKCRPVMDVEDVRPFLRKTQGSGSMHAFSRGLAALAMSGKSAQWIVDLTCDRCGEHNGSLVPVPVTAHGIITDYATGHDALLCPTCRSEA